MSRPSSEAVELALLELRTFSQVCEQLAWASRAEAELEQVNWPWLLSRLVKRVEDELAVFLAPSETSTEHSFDGRELTL